MSELLLPIIPGTLPEGTCWPANPDDFQKLILGLARAKFNQTFNGVVYGENTPGSSDWDKLWVRQDSGGNLIRIYTHGDRGVWVSPHSVPAGGKLRQLWVGSEDDLKTFDEGVDERVTAVTGPFWQIDHDFDFSFLVGPGTNPATYDGNPATIIGVGDTGGEERHKLTIQEMPAHHHDVVAPKRKNSGTASWESSDGSDGNDTVVSQDTGGDKTHQNLPPYRGIYVIKRTARVYYRV